MKKLFLLLLLALPLHAQNQRVDIQFPLITSTTSTPFLEAPIGPNLPTLQVCASPANQVPCSNYVSTFTAAGIACPNGAQDTPQPATTSACQATGDSSGNLGFWIPAGTYDYTLTIGINSYGPFTITVGGSGGGGGTGTVSSVTATAPLAISGTPSVNPNVFIQNNPTLPGNVTTSGNLTVNGSITLFGQTFAGFSGNSGVFAQSGALATTTGILCLDANKNITNIGCPAVLIGDSTFFFTPGTETLTVFNEQINGTLSFAGPLQFNSTNPTSPLPLSIFGNSTISAQVGGGFCISINGGTCNSISTSGAGSPSVLLAPSAAQDIVQPLSSAVSTALTVNNFQNIRYVDADWNWAFTDSAGSLGNLTSAGASKTLTLPSCPAGIDTASTANHYVYAVYISGTGTAEAAPVTGGTCTPGLGGGGTIIITTKNNHANGYTVGSASTGIQEAWNDAWVNDSGTAPNASSQAAPYLKLESNTPYNVYSSVFLRGRGGILDGAGAIIACSTRDRCIYVGITSGSPGVNHHKLYNLTMVDTLLVDGANVSSVSASSGTYTVTTTATHPFVAGDTVDCEYHSQTSDQHWMATVLAAGLTGTQFEVTFGSLTFSAGAANFGFCNIENAAIEDNSDNVVIQDIHLIVSNPLGTGAFNYGIVNDNDQHLVIERAANRSASSINPGPGHRTSLWPIGSFVYERNDNGNDGITYLQNSEFTNINCFTGAGNGVVITNTVCQANVLFGFRYFGGLQPATFENNYEENGLTNPLYSGSLIASMGYLSQGGFGSKFLGTWPIAGVTPTFVGTGSTCTQRNYYVVPHSSAISTGIGPVIYIGTSGTATCATTVNLQWPSTRLQDTSGVSIGTLTWDVLATTGTTTPPPNGTGNYLVSGGTGISGSCTTTGMCSFTDNQSALSSYTVAGQTFHPTFWFWPAAIVMNGAAPLVFDSLPEPISIVSQQGTLGVSAIAQQCYSGGTIPQYARSPVWLSCINGPTSGGAGSQATVLQQADQSNNGPFANSKGRINLGKQLGLTPNDLITLTDSNQAKTLSTAGERPTNDANDGAIGTDQSGGIYARAQATIAQYIGKVPDLAPQEQLTNSLKSFTVPLSAPSCAGCGPVGTQTCTIYNTNGSGAYSTDCPMYESKFAAGASPDARVRGLILTTQATNGTIVINAMTETGTWLSGPFEDLYGSGMSPRKTGILLMPCGAPATTNRSWVVPSGWSIIPCGRQYVGNTGTVLTANTGTFQSTYITGTATNTAAVAGATFTVTSVNNASAGTTVYNGTFTGCGSNACINTTAYIAGFVTNPTVNNGLFKITASTAGALTLSNANGIAETHAAIAEVSYIFTVTGIGATFTTAMIGSYYGACDGVQVTGTSCGATTGANAQGLIVGVPNSTTLQVITRNTGSGTVNSSGVNYVITTPLIQMGDSAGESGNPFNYDLGIGILDVAGTADCAGVNGCIPIVNRSASNLATVGKWVLGLRDGPGILVEENQSQNSGPYGPFWAVKGSSTCTATAMGGMVRSSSTVFNFFTGGSSATANCGSVGTNEGIVNDSPSDIAHIHVGPVQCPGSPTDCASTLISGGHAVDVGDGNNINLGNGCTPVCYSAPGTASGSKLEDINIFNGAETGVHLGSNLSPANVQISGINSGLSAPLHQITNLFTTAGCAIPYGNFSLGVSEPGLNYFNVNNGTDFFSSSTIPGCAGLRASGPLVGNNLGPIGTATTGLSSGVPVKLDTSNANQYVQTTTSDTGAGIVVGVAGAGITGTNSGQIVTSGKIAMTLGTGTCAIGNFVIVDTTANGRVKCTGSFTAGTVIGTAMIANSSVGTTFNVMVGLR